MKIIHELVQQDEEAGHRLWEFLLCDTFFGNYEYIVNTTCSIEKELLEKRGFGGNAPNKLRLCCR